MVQWVSKVCSYNEYTVLFVAFHFTPIEASLQDNFLELEFLGQGGVCISVFERFGQSIL